MPSVRRHETTSDTVGSNDHQLRSVVLGRVIAELRAQAGCTQGALGKAVGVPQSTVSRFESGRQVPDAFQLQRIAELVGVGVDEIHTWTEEGVRRTKRAADAAVPDQELTLGEAILAVAGVVALAGLATFVVAALLKPRKTRRTSR